jgi:hypothetical protein
MAIANIDTQESYVEGVSLADTNAYQFKIIAKPEKQSSLQIINRMEILLMWMPRR